MDNESRWSAFKKKSPEFQVSYNRKDMERTGSLAPDLLHKIDRKHRKLHGLVPIVTPPKESQITSKNATREASPLGSTGQPRPSYVMTQTLKELLKTDPDEDRYEALKKHRLEFMSYLRPLLKE